LGSGGVVYGFYGRPVSIQALYQKVKVLEEENRALRAEVDVLKRLGKPIPT
jgi:cell division protein FtsB